MKRFSFPLERVMEFREAQAAAEKQKLAMLMQQLGQVNESLKQLHASRQNAEQSLAGSGRIVGLELNTLGAFRAAVQQREQSLLRTRGNLEARIAEQRREVVKLRRQHRLLEKLRERRLAEWAGEVNREAEQLTAECFLSGWSRERLRNRAKTLIKISDI